MSGPPDRALLDLLDLLQRQNAHVITVLERVAGDLRALKERAMAVEAALAGVNSRLDRHVERLDRIECHLGIQKP